MAYLIRKVSLGKWESCVGKSLGKYNADAITGCTRTSRNTLSVWRTDNPDLKSKENILLITAIATIQQNLDILDLVILDEESLLEAGVLIENTLGESRIAEMNDYHRDLHQLDYEKLGIVSEKIVSAVNSDGTWRRISISEVQDLIVSHYGTDLSNSGLSSSLISKINKRIANASSSTS